MRWSRSESEAAAREGRPWVKRPPDARRRRLTGSTASPLRCRRRWRRRAERAGTAHRRCVQRGGEKPLSRQREGDSEGAESEGREIEIDPSSFDRERRGRDSGAGEGHGFRTTARNERCLALPVGLRAIGKVWRAQTDSRQAHHLPTCRTSQPNPATFSRLAFGESSSAIYLYGGTRNESGPPYVTNPIEACGADMPPVSRLITVGQ